MKEVYNILNTVLPNHSTVVIGLSGGQDSMCLLHLLIEYRYTHDIKIVAAHVNHNIREESKEEQEFLREYCNDNEIIFVTTTLHETNKSEANLRQKRYAFFATIIKQFKSTLLLTAHHGDDLIETILMHLTRGSSLKGYTGFHPLTKTENCFVFRPLIFITKKDISDYINKYNIPYVTDQSNQSPTYTRNRYRQNILPFLKEENQKVHQKFYEFSEELAKCHNYIDSVIDKLIAKNQSKSGYNLNSFDKEDAFIQEKIIERFLAIYYTDNLPLLTKKHLSLVLNLAKSPGNSRLDLPGNLTIAKEYNTLKCYKDTTSSLDYSFTLNNELTLPNDSIIKIEKESNDKSNYITRLNSEEIALPLIVRTRKPKDIMAVKNLNGSKKVQDIFTDCKLSKQKRETQPILTDSKGTILWIPGLKKSKFDKEKNEKYDIIIKYYSNL